MYKITNKANWADNDLHFAWPLHKRTWSTKSLVYLVTYALVERSDLEYLRISDRPLQQLLTLHMYFAAVAAIPRILFYPIWRFIVLLSEWPPIVSWSLLLYSLESETGQPCFSYKSYMKTNCNAKYFQTPLGQLHAPRN